MAHKIEQYDRQQGIQQAWHGLTQIKSVITLEDNWLREWDLVPRKMIDADSKEELPWAYLRCSDNPKINVGQPYNPATFQPVNNAAFLDMIKASIAGTQHEIVSVGSVRNRGRVFLSLKLNGMEEFTAGGRKFSAFLNFGNGHDKSSVLWANTSNTCTVCDNTFSSNLFTVENKATAITENSDDIRIRQRHTKNVIMHLPEIAKLVDKAIGVQAEFQLAFDKLSQVPLSISVARNLFAGFIGRRVVDVDKGLSTRSSNTVSRLVNLYQSGPGNSGNNKSDAFSAVTDFYSHYSSGNGDNPMRQFLSSEYGAGQQSKSDFWKLMSDTDDKSFEATIDLGAKLMEHTAA